MGKPLQLTQEEARKMFPQLADRANLRGAPVAKRGDGSRYGKRHVSGQMNKTEAEYAAVLEAEKLAGEIHEYWFESVRLKLAEGLTYTSDFMVFLKDGTILFVDVKGTGPIEQKSIDKAKVAAKTYRMWKFTMAIKQKAGGFRIREFRN